MPQDYSKTLNLPNTEFSMRANLPTREPEIGKVWEEKNVYKLMLEKNEGKPLFILHDGPPFSNGNIHMGTSMNKVLKDFINKYKSMTGFKVPYVPGWDNHGMPIESAIIKKNKLDHKNMSVSEFRTACHDFAQDFVNIQMTSFKRLGVLGDWENPYLTMDPKFEAREVKVFGEMYKKGYIYKGLKPVYWCPHDETALAEAEIEYKDVDCTSIYVKFKVNDDLGKFSALDLDNTYFIIWTTTTWTLPGNLAIAVHPREKYVAVKANGETYIVADALAEKTMAAAGITEFERVAEFVGSDFEYMTAKHPFLDRDSKLLLAEYVTMDSGTGCVHTAPGFGADDYMTCMRYKMDIVVPVDDRGYQTEAAGKFAGMYYEESNEAILADMKESGALFASEKVSHSYPHCWRCKNPIIFRATPQWFCSVDAFRTEAVKACEGINWMPAWGGDRMISMINERADWCISRQRRWGLPIPVFYCPECKKPVCTEETIAAVSAEFAKSGSNAWFDKTAEELMPAGTKCPHCGCDHGFTKETDTLDCWFDSGSTHFAVLEDGELSKWSGMRWPADLYLEGADQYRGWFQSSLLTAVGAKGEGAPYKAVLTHGWVVDGEGKAMHKSLGNSVYPEDVIKKYGADLLRLWVASSDYTVDVRCSDNLFKQFSETYRKFRNTARILLANLGNIGEDFDPNTDLVPVSELEAIDKWALSRLNKLVKEANEAYSNYDFHIVVHAIANFCTVDMSKLYIDITKDRLYVENKDSKTRRAAQTAMYMILSALTRLTAPILSYTAEEIWAAMKHVCTDNTVSVFLNDIPKYDEALDFGGECDGYNKLFNLRDDVMKALELARADKLIGKSLDAKLTVFAADKEAYDTLNAYARELEDIFIVSGVTLVNEAAPADAFTETASGIGVKVEAADGVKCDRCWKYSTDTVTDGDGCLCARCKKVVG